MKRSRMGQPEWANQEERKLSREWLDSDTELSITDYIWEHASPRLRSEYNRQKEACKGMKFGRVVFPNGDMIIYN